jgi:hypothetical protein
MGSAYIILLDNIFSHLIEFIDTMSYGNMLAVSNELQRKCIKYKKTRYPFIVIEDVYQYGDTFLSKTCKDEFYNLQLSRFNTMEKISKDMSPHLHQLLVQIVEQMGLDKASDIKFRLRFYSVPWRFRKCIHFEEYNDRFYMGIDSELYITSCFQKCKKIIKDTPKEIQQEIESILFQKLLRKYQKSKHIFRNFDQHTFDQILNNKFAKRK